MTKKEKNERNFVKLGQLESSSFTERKTQYNKYDMIYNIKSRMRIIISILIHNHEKERILKM